MVNFTLPSTTNEMISISTSQTFGSWVVIFHLHRPKAFLSLNLYDTPGLAPISWPWHRAWPSPKYEWFPWSICNGCGLQAGNAYPSGHLVLSPFFGTCLCSSCWDQIPRTCHVFTRFVTLNTNRYFLDFADNGDVSILIRDPICSNNINLLPVNFLKKKSFCHFLLALMESRYRPF